MGEDLGEVVEGRYPKLCLGSGMSLPELRDLNRAVYAGLSSESHARLRLDPKALQVRTDGTVSVIPQAVDTRAKKTMVLGCVDSSLREASAALAYLIERRESLHAEELQHVAGHLAQGPLPPGFKPDLGLHLMRCGGRSTTFHFPNAPAHELGILPDGTVMWSRELVFGDQEYVATFHVPHPLISDLARALGIELDALEPGTQSRKHTLTAPTSIRLVCRLGDIHQSTREAFVPLLVTRVDASMPGT
jgi:hypothetical protein